MDASRTPSTKVPVSFTFLRVPVSSSALTVPMKKEHNPAAINEI